MMLSSRERRTLLAALQCWQNEFGFHSVADLQQFYAVLGGDPLTPDEVEALKVRVAVTDDPIIVSEIVNAVQVVAGLATRMRQVLGATVEESVQLEAASDRVVQAVRRLRPEDRR